MNDFITKYGTQLIAGFIAISGILLGLFWNQFFAWRKNKREQKAKLNRLLFHLLELYFFVSRNDFTSFITIYMAQMEKRFGAIPKEERAQVEQVIISMVKEKLNNLNDEEEIKRLSEHYEAAVKEVAFINPFLAYRLAGQSKRLNHLEQLNGYFDSVRELISTEEEQKLLQSILSNYTEDRLIKEMITDVKDSIIEIAKEIGIAKHLEAKKHFARQEKNMKEEVEKEVTQIVDQIEAQIPKNV